MKVPKSELAVGVAAAYLLLVLVVSSPLIIDGAIHHGNGISFLGVSFLTLSLSWIAFRVIDSLSETNAFYMVGATYYLAIGVLAACTVVNAIIIYLLVDIVGRKLGTFARKPAK